MRINMYKMVVGLLVVLSACQQKEAKKEVVRAYTTEVTRYYVRYVEAKKELQAEVAFQVGAGDTLLPQKYFFGEKQMEAKRLPKVGLAYRLVQSPTNFATPFVFRYPSADGGERRDTLAMPLLTGLRLGSKGLSLSKGGVLVWEGEALTANDLFRIIITDAAGGVTTINHVGLTQKNELPLPLEQIATLPKGKAVFSVSLTRTVAAPHISLKGEYYFGDFAGEIGG